jgi:hypothetical protein
MSSNRHAPIFDVHPQTGAPIEVFFDDLALETFGRGGAGWFWWPRRRGFSPDSPAIGPFATSYAAYRHALQDQYEEREAPPRNAPRKPSWGRIWGLFSSENKTFK